MQLVELFRQLPQPSTIGSYSAAPVGSNCRIAKSSDNYPALLVELTQRNGMGLQRQLINISYVPPMQVEIVGDGVSSSRELAILKCETHEAALASYFLRVVSSILLPEAASGDEARFEASLDTVITLFRALQRPGSKTLQGLWAELAMIAWSHDPAAAIAGWHSNPRALHDFAAGTARLEVKSTTDELREHVFLLDQLLVQGGTTLVASLMLSRAVLGVSINDLVRVVRGRVNSAESAKRLETIVMDSLGNSFDKAEELKFDFDGALESLRLFRAEQIPAVSPPTAPEVKEVQFSVDLSRADDVPLADARSIDAFYASLLPTREPVRGAS